MIVMNDNVHFILLAVFLCALCILGTRFLKNYKFKQLLNCIKNQDVSRFSQIANSRLTKLLFPPYNIEYLKLNAFLLEGNEQEIDHQFTKMLDFNLGKTQRCDLLLKAYDYYLSKRNKKQCKSILKDIKSLEEKELYQDALKCYLIIFEKSTKYVDEMESQLHSIDDKKKSYLEYLLSIQYENLGNSNKSNFYKEQSLLHSS